MVDKKLWVGLYSKFFGKPNSASKAAPTQQTKLSFATKATTSKAKENVEDNEESVGEEEKNNKAAPSSPGSASDASAKENSEPVKGERRPRFRTLEICNIGMVFCFFLPWLTVESRRDQEAWATFESIQSNGKGGC